MTGDTQTPQPDPITELNAMARMLEALDPLDPPGVGRALRWVADYHGLTRDPDPVPETEVAAALAGSWASAVLDMLDAGEIEQSCLDAQSWGDGPSMAEAMLREIKRRFQIVAGTREASELWPST